MSQTEKRLQLNGREIILLGTAHVSQESINQVTESIKAELSQLWYKKKDVLMAARGGMEEIIFSPDLPRYLAEEWSRLRGMYAFLSDIEAE